MLDSRFFLIVGQSIIVASSFLLVVFVDPVLAQTILAEQYIIEGANPDGNGAYRGKVAVVMTGETYQVAWRIGNTKHRGTGILEGNVFSVIYKSEGAVAGIAVYRIKTNGTLVGRWVGLTGVALGTEIWKSNKGI